MLALVAYSLKQVKLLGPYKRTQHSWATTRNIVVTLLRPFAGALKAIQTEAILLANNLTCNMVGPNMLHPFAWNHNNVSTCCV